MTQKTAENKRASTLFQIVLLLLSFSIGYLICYTQSQGNEDYINLEKSLMEKLINVNAATTSGLNSEEFQILTREVSVLVNQLKLHKKMPTNEQEVLDNLINQMSTTMSLWNLQTKCIYRKKDNGCTEELTTILYYDKFPALNPNYKNSSADERFFINSENSNYKEYKNVYMNSAFENNDDPYATSVSAYLTRTSSAIKAYFLTKDISIN